VTAVIYGLRPGRLCVWEHLGKSILGSHRADSHPLILSLPIGEACWWTMHPASKQRSEGEKVRVGDDLILVSVSSERYLVSNPPPQQVLQFPRLGVQGTGPISSFLVCPAGPTFLSSVLEFSDF
jgi:hypothetical protein